MRTDQIDPVCAYLDKVAENWWQHWLVYMAAGVLHIVTR